MVQVTIAHHTSPSLSNLQPHSIYDFNGSLFESKYIFLYNTHHSMAFSLDEIWADFTPPGRTLTWVSNIYTHLTYSPFTQIPFYSIPYDYHLRHNSLHIHPIFFHICYFNAVITFETHPYPRHYHLQIYSVTLPRQEHMSIWVRFLKAFFFYFSRQYGTQIDTSLSQILFYPLLELVFIPTHKNQFVCSVPTTFSCSLSTYEF